MTEGTAFVMGAVALKSFSMVTPDKHPDNSTYRILLDWFLQHPQKYPLHVG